MPDPSTPPRPQEIALEGVRVHNLKGISVRLPLGRLIALCGVSGSGKSSLAFDTLYAEGQRRYIESFSPYARQFLDRLEKPEADRIEPIPPSIALRQGSRNPSARSTVATATEIHDYLRLLFARVGEVVCPDCRRVVRADSPQSVLDVVRGLATGTRFQVGFAVVPSEGADVRGTLEQLAAAGLDRVVIGGKTGRVSEVLADDGAGLPVGSGDSAPLIVVDRLTAGTAAEERVLDSVETAFRFGEDRCVLLEERPAETAGAEDLSRDAAREIDGRLYRLHRFSTRWECGECGREFLPPEPRLFSFSSAVGACPECHGFGAVPAISFEKVVPDPSKSLRDGAIVPWTTPAYRHELDELLALAGDYGIPVDVPFAELSEEQRALIRDGVPARRFGGLRGFFRWLERHKYKMGVRIFLNRWRAYETCPVCQGDRLQPAALAVRLPATAEPPDASEFGPNIAELCRGAIGDVVGQMARLRSSLSESQRSTTRMLFPAIESRLGYLEDVGLGYLTLDRATRTLSAGEAQRIALTATLGSGLVNMLYVLDEPSAGLHPRDTERVWHAAERLRDAGNTVVVVEHDETFLRGADHIVEIGPGAGRDGGEVVFEGTPAEIERAEASVTGAYLSGRATLPSPAPDQRRARSGTLRLTGARRHNLKDLTVEFPLGVLCVVTGVSGSGKSTLVEETLYPAVQAALRQGGRLAPRVDSARGASRPPWHALEGADQIDEVVLVDQSPIGRTPRSNPITYLEAFDEIRKLFSATPEAKLRHFTATQFSFNAAGGGRCPRCEGNGSIAIDMQFLADVSVVCPECHGTRYRREVLEVKYRGLNIAEALNLTAREAFAFFARQTKLQRKLQFLKEVGLDYLPLGQPATTLSGGESQRLKLAARLASGSKSRTLFLMDEPTTGLHPADVARLLACFDTLLSVGHSLIVIEHDLGVIRAADHVIDLGPDAGDRGGEIVAAGTPEEVERSTRSVTGQYLRQVMQRKN